MTTEMMTVMDATLDAYSAFIHAKAWGTTRDGRSLLSAAADLQLAINKLALSDPKDAAAFEQRLGWTVETTHHAS